MADAESQRLAEDAQRTANWKRWGPYLSERQWGTVREDYSATGECWDYFPFDHAARRAYRWGEDGLFGFSDRECRLCFSVALWNGADPILKERLFGLAGPEGNHGEDVKEEYFYLDATPTTSYAKALYKYPQREFPYEELRRVNRERGRAGAEYELCDTGAFAGNRYFDVFAEFAKAAPDDVLIRITAINRGPDRARLHVLPQLWFRNTWTWGCDHEGCTTRPELVGAGPACVRAVHPTLGTFSWSCAEGPGGRPPELWFTENETNFQAVFGAPNAVAHVKDAFHEALVRGRRDVLSGTARGTKACAVYVLELESGAAASIDLRLAAESEACEAAFGPRFRAMFEQRQAEADAFYSRALPPELTAAERRVSRQAYAGLLWSRQFYHYVVKDWLAGDPSQPVPPAARLAGRNAEWRHLFNRDVISMPDKWEYPWYAAWDLAFHTVPFARVDPQFAKDQLVLFLREWYMHPNGQIPAYEFALGDVNPPVHAWAAWRVYKIAAGRGQRDRDFLARVFHKLVINFTWWVNRKDPRGRNVFGGGFLGLDNIGVFDRSQPLPTGGTLEQADGTAWMAFYCGTMLSMALELARTDPSMEDMASKFFEHFVAIVDAMNGLDGSGLWDEHDGFYYDRVHADGDAVPLRVRSMVGIIPLFAAEVLEQQVIDRLPGFRKRMQWFLDHRQDLARHIAYCDPNSGAHGHRLLAVPSKERLLRVLRYVLDEDEFLSPYGVRSLSRRHREHPFVFAAGGREYRVDYAPGESATGMFGGNSNWRGPVWFPLNYLLIEALRRYHHFYGDELTVEFPTGSGRRMHLLDVARELAARLSRLFLPGPDGARPCHGGDSRYANDPGWKDLVLFHEYFHGETGQGLGASHQTGWTALVVRALEDVASARRERGAGYNP